MISIHAAREGGDGHGGIPASDYYRFQSTPPVKAATEDLGGLVNHVFISIHAAREGGDHTGRMTVKFNYISIHAAREGGDADPHRCNYSRNHFNPRRP